MKLTTALLAAALSAATLTAGSCNIVGPLMILASGPEKTPAQFILPKDKTAVIAIDDRGSVLPQRNLRDMIGKTGEEEILAKQLVKDMVASRLVTAIMAHERTGDPMPIADLGKAVNADMVIFVAMEQFTLSEDGSTLSPLAVARVKIVDSKTGVRLGPPENDPTGFFTLTVRLPPQGNVAPTTSNELSMLQDLARVTGVYLSRMFWDSEKITEPTKLEDK
ncbi:MAG: hypothetical protein QM783_11430 [Phycisphaerales bacterium]